MQIGEVARTLGTDPPTIRYYESVGILPVPERRGNRYRNYADDDVRRIGLVLALRRLDVPVSDIRTLVGTCFDHRCSTSTNQLLEVIDRRSGWVHQQIHELRALADQFADLRRQLVPPREGDTTMAIDTAPTQTQPDEQHIRAATCDCGCSGDGCGCGCACCEGTEHAEHQSAVVVLAQAPQVGCDCGCCS